MIKVISNGERNIKITTCHKCKSNISYIGEAANAFTDVKLKTDYSKSVKVEEKGFLIKKYRTQTTVREIITRFVECPSCKDIIEVCPIEVKVVERTYSEWQKEQPEIII